VAALLEQGLQLALAAPAAKSAWGELLGSGETVGLKLSCLGGAPLAPTRELVEALCASLAQAGVPSERVVVFERGERDLRKGGFEVRRSGGPLFVANDTPGLGYEEEPEISGEVGSCLSRILTRKISVMINVGVLKDHSLSGVSAALKNLYGLIHNPNKYHDSTCDPYLADVLAFPVVQRKLKLSVIDAITAQCQGGPAYFPDHAWPFNGLLISTDPVALDRVAWEIIEERRKASGLPSLAKENRAPKWLRTAAARGLGQDDLSRIQILRGG
jgi:uncharacterized protein (DUF362 family)